MMPIVVMAGRFYSWMQWRNEYLFNLCYVVVSGPEVKERNSHKEVLRLCCLYKFKERLMATESTEHTEIKLFLFSVPSVDSVGKENKGRLLYRQLADNE
jgi:hypothetical protein